MATVLAATSLLVAPVDAAQAAGPAQFSYVVAADNGELIASNYFSASGEIWHWAVRSNGHSSWVSLGGSGGQVTVPPAVITNPSGTLEVFAIADGWLKHKYQLSPGGSWSGWIPLGTTTLQSVYSKLAVALNADGRAELFVTKECELLHLWRNGDGTWSDFASLGNPANRCIAEPIAEENADGRLEVFGIGTDNGVSHLWQQTPGASWSEWAGLINAFPGVPIGVDNLQTGTNKDGSLELLFSIAGEYSNYYEVHYLKQTPAGWTSGSTGGYVLSSYPFGHDWTAVGNQQDGRLTHFLVEGDSVYYQSQTAPNGSSWSPRSKLGTVPGSPGVPAALTVASYPDGRMEVLAHTNGSTLYHACQLTPNGSWTAFTPVTDTNCDTIPPPTPGEPSQKIRNGNSGKCLAIGSSSTANGANAIQWDCLGSSGQQWYFEDHPTQPGWYRIRNGSGKCLAIGSSSTANGANAIQWDCINTSSGQRWQLGPNYSLINGSGKCLAIGSSSTTNGANAIQWDCLGSNSQKWIWG